VEADQANIVVDVHVPLVQLSLQQALDALRQKYFVTRDLNIYFCPIEYGTEIKTSWDHHQPPKFYLKRSLMRFSTSGFFLYKSTACRPLVNTLK
jgi:hypothetical protein